MLDPEYSATYFSVDFILAFTSFEVIACNHWIYHSRLFQASFPSELFKIIPRKFSYCIFKPNDEEFGSVSKLAWNNQESSTKEVHDAYGYRH